MLARHEELHTIPRGAIETVQLCGCLVAHQCKRPERRESDAEPLFPARRCPNDAPHIGRNPFEPASAYVVPHLSHGEADGSKVRRAHDAVLRRGEAGDALPLVEGHAPVCTASRRRRPSSSSRRCSQAMRASPFPPRLGPRGDAGEGVCAGVRLAASPSRSHLGKFGDAGGGCGGFGWQRRQSGRIWANLATQARGFGGWDRRWVERQGERQGWRRKRVMALSPTVARFSGSSMPRPSDGARHRTPTLPSASLRCTVRAATPTSVSG
jgi:hypothetical protein